jgi:hypothetical protein
VAEPQILDYQTVLVAKPALPDESESRKVFDALDKSGTAAIKIVAGKYIHLMID